MDPWGSTTTEPVNISTEFEDNFKDTALPFEKLSDSAQYLAILERKLKSVRSKSKVVENLSAYKIDCLERLMREGCDLEPVIGNTEEDKLLQD